LRRLSSIHPQYADKVQLLVVDMDLGEELDYLSRFAQEQRYPFPLSVTDARTLQNFNYVGRSSKFGVDRSGVIVYRAGYGEGSEAEWHGLFEQLAKQPDTP
jgi:hypothetical protein